MTRSSLASRTGRRLQDSGASSTNVVLLVGVVVLGALMVATGSISVYLLATMLVTAVVAVAGLVSFVDYDGPQPAIVGAYLLIVLALVVA